jgi:hypothetical protein
VLRFFADPAAEGSVWQVQLGSGDKPGFGLAAADGKLALFVDGATGNVGIGVGAKKPEAALHIAGNLKVEAGSIKLDSNQKVFFMDNGQIGGRDQYHQLLFRCTESITELREWGSIWLTAGNETCNNKPQIVVSQAEVKIGARLRISENNGTAANEVFGSLLLDHEDAGGASSIVFRSKEDQDSDYSFIEYKDKNPATQGVGASLLTIGNRNDSNDHIALMPSGNVGIDTTTPEFKLDVNGTVRLGGFTTEEKDEWWSNIVWCRDLAKGWDEGLIKHGKSNGFFGRAGFGVHMHESRSFELFSTNARPLLGVEGGTGNTSIRGNVKVNGCITPSAGNSESTGILFPKDPGGGTGDSAWLRYYPYKDENCVLEIGISNDPGDYIYLKSIGGVKIDAIRLADKWRLSGVGDWWANDEWLRIADIANTGFYGGLAAGKFWTNTGQYNQSDLRSKDNISNIISPLESLLNLQGVSFTWKENLETSEGNGTESLGLIAQDVQKVFPQLVQNGPNGKLGVNYIGLIPVLVECIKEQQVQIQSLRDQLINHL